MVPVLDRRRVEGWVLCSPTHQEIVWPCLEFAKSFGCQTLSLSLKKKSQEIRSRMPQLLSHLDLEQWLLVLNKVGDSRGDQLFHPKRPSPLKNPQTRT